jgi:unsaturated rhamnogalacturonyl hydrolase
MTRSFLATLSPQECIEKSVAGARRSLWSASIVLGVCLSSSAAAAAQPTKIAPAATLQAMEKVGDWQLANLVPPASIKTFREESSRPRSWEQAAFYIGLTQLAERSKSPRFREAILKHGRQEQWTLGDRKYHADDHAIGQSYLWAYAHGAGPGAIAPMKKTFDEILAAPAQGSLSADDGAKCFDRWCWCDALFMAPPAWVELSKVTGDRRYADFSHEEWQSTQDYLYDREEHLFFRDSRFFQQRDEKGRKLFWSRGNGWVVGGIVRVLAVLPKNDPARPRYEALFQEMMAKLLELQKPDGYWAPSLLALENSPPETSGTGFFIYGMAWGIESGLLERKTYEPAVVRGWQALQRAVEADGRLGWVQQVGDRPQNVMQEDTQFYGVGAYLLAGSAVYDLYSR